MPEEKKELSVVDANILAKLRENSGESTSQRPFVPIYQVDNTKVKETVGTREVDVVCEPRYKVLTKDENGEYKTDYIKSFGGAVLKIMWQVVNEGEWDDKLKAMVDNGAPKFRSSLFSPSVFLGKKYVNIKYEDGGEVESLTYQNLKANYDKKFNLIGWVFALYNNELIRIKMTGSSRSVLFDFPKEFKANDSISAHPIVFSAEYVEKPQPHNVAKFEIATDQSVPFDIDKVLAAQELLNQMFNSTAQNVMEVVGGEVISEEDHSDEIRVDDIPFK